MPLGSFLWLSGSVWEASRAGSSRHSAFSIGPEGLPGSWELAPNRDPGGFWALGGRNQEGGKQANRPRDSWLQDWQIDIPQLQDCKDNRKETIGQGKGTVGQMIVTISRSRGAPKGAGGFYLQRRYI